MKHAIIHTLEHSWYLFPFLFIAYILIEVLEYFCMSKLKHSKLLSNKWSTLFGAGFGLVPQCGFSVIATDLFASHKIKIGTLLAVYIATSDEAIPRMLANPDKISFLLPLLLVKFVIAILVGYLVDLIFRKFNKKHLSLSQVNNVSNLDPNIEQTLNNNPESEHENHNHNQHEEESEEHHKGCCGHELDNPSKKDKLKAFLLHPLIHALKIFGFILLVNFIFNLLFEFIGEDSIRTFLQNSKEFAPLASSFIGLIPNCASSVIITELYIGNFISFGACVGGLIVNAGIAFVVLFKQNKNVKQNFAILGGMLLIGITVGYIIQLIGF